MSRRFRIAHIPLREANGFIAKHHRHHVPSPVSIIALGMWEGERLVGVGVLGKPVSRELMKQGYCEVTRICIAPDLEPSGQHASGAASMMLSRLRKLATILGYERLVTYTLPTESGASLRGDGWKQDEMLVGGNSWSVPGRARPAANYPMVRKLRWWAPLKAQSELTL